MKGARIVLALVLLATAAVALVLRPHLPAAERGRRLAERTGCFACHGPGGLHGASNPTRDDGTAPEVEGDVMMYAKSLDEIRQWSEDGVTAKKAKSETWHEQRRLGVLKMP